MVKFTFHVTFEFFNDISKEKYIDYACFFIKVIGLKKGQNLNVVMTDDPGNSS